MRPAATVCSSFFKLGWQRKEYPFLCSGNPMFLIAAAADNK